MTKDERIKKYVEKMRFAQNSDDPEAAHSAADDALCVLLRELGYGAVVDEWDKVEKWYA